VQSAQYNSSEAAMALSTLTGPSLIPLWNRWLLLSRLYDQCHFSLCFHPQWSTLCCWWEEKQRSDRRVSQP